MGKGEIIQFLDYLASDRNVAANTQRIALNTLMFLYSKILEQRVSNMGFKLAGKLSPVVMSGNDEC